MRQMSDKTSERTNKLEKKKKISKIERYDDKKIEIDESDSSQLWVDKYKPKNMKQLIGQQGDKSCARKLLNWLSKWHDNRAAGRKPLFGAGKWADQDGGGYRAALLSGPPGIGKTTMSVLVCQELGYTYVELNASDARSKKSITEQVLIFFKSYKL